MREIQFSKKWLGSFLLLLPVLILCIRYVDEPVAQFVKENLSRHEGWVTRTGRMPDLLLQLVILTTIVAWSMYLVRVRRGIHDVFNRFLILVSWASPLSYLAKAILKPIFGRLNNRLWFKTPELYGFHWFRVEQGYDAFPSGHMLVAVTLMAVLGRFYRWTRVPSWTVAIILALLLMGTGFHFLSDIIAGAYAGLALEAVLFRFLSGTASFQKQASSVGELSSAGAHRR